MEAVSSTRIEQIPPICASKDVRSWRTFSAECTNRARYRDPVTRRERSKTFDRKVDAERFLALATADIARGTWIDPSGAQLTFSSWWETYLEQSGKRPATQARDHGAAVKWLLPHLGHLRLGEITPTAVRSLVVT